MADPTNMETAGPLTAEQYQAVLQGVAGQMATLERLLMLLQTEVADDDFARSTCLDAARLICTSVGAITDSASGSDVVGDADRWHFGPNFRELGKLQQARHGAPS
jgi:hypothetical protein